MHFQSAFAMSAIAVVTATIAAISVAITIPVAAVFEILVGFFAAAASTAMVASATTTIFIVAEVTTATTASATFATAAAGVFAAFRFRATLGGACGFLVHGFYLAGFSRSGIRFLIFQENFFA
jgi:hypothetical protein